MRICDIIKQLAGLAETDPLEPVHSKNLFLYLLRRERARTELTEGKFSVIGFLPREPESVPVLRHLARILQQRVRITDDIGWLDDQQLGVLLPFTDDSGAWKLADAVCELFPDDIMPPLCTVYTHPYPASSGAGSNALAEEAKLVGPLEMLSLHPHVGLGAQANERSTREALEYAPGCRTFFASETELYHSVKKLDG
jgi:hypothetical protein